MKVSSIHTPSPCHKGEKMKTKMKIMVKDKKAGEVYLGEFESLKEAKEYWIQGNAMLRWMVRHKMVIFEEVEDF